MAMGIISDEDLLKELENCDRPIITKPEVIRNEKIHVPELIESDHGRRPGDNNVPSALRALISETAQLDGRKEALEFANSFGISASSVSAYTREVNSTDHYNKPQAPEIKNHVDRIKKNISKKARNVLKSALDNITEEKLTESKATELASVAKSMSSIITEMEPSQEREDKSVPQIIIYAPAIRTEQSFEFINIQE